MQHMDSRFETPLERFVRTTSAFRAEVCGDVTSEQLRAFIVRMDRHLADHRFAIEDKWTNPIGITRPGAVMDSFWCAQIQDWLLEQPECKLVREIRGDNPQVGTMKLSFLDESGVLIYASRLRAR
jgi:hypothetical protein